jgi:hypothetical protein
MAYHISDGGMRFNFTRFLAMSYKKNIILIYMYLQITQVAMCVCF